MAMIIIRLLVVFFVYYDAKKRGHETIRAVLWSVGSCVVPYVILPLYFLLGRKTKKQNQYYGNDVIDIEATVVEESINCTRCGNKIKEDVSVCPYCKESTVTSKKDN
ncbi:MAG: Double zinc ribbon [Firmicutes bacterium]|nr:Double zinc ribbon [Bacillota bacterium]